MSREQERHRNIFPVNLFPPVDLRMTRPYDDK